MTHDTAHHTRRLIGGMVLAAGLTGAWGAWAQPAESAADRAGEQTQAENRQQVYGWQLMTPEERQALQARMRSAQTSEERHRIRAEHHAMMQSRARERGVELPDMKPGRGMGMKPGQGGGAGPGGQQQRKGSGKGPGR